MRAVSSTLVHNLVKQLQKPSKPGTIGTGLTYSSTFKHYCSLNVINVILSVMTVRSNVRSKHGILIISN